LPSGKIKLEYGYLGDDCERLLVVSGPRMLIPLENEMTDEEFDSWEFELLTDSGFFQSFSNTSIDAPLVEAKRTYEDEIPKGSVKAELFWMEVEGKRTVGVRLVSSWSRPIPGFSLSTDCRYDAPQPEQHGLVEAQVLGGSESGFHALGAHTGRDLCPRVVNEFCLDPALMPPLLSRAASLSTESHWIALRTDGCEFDRIPGDVVAGFLTGADG
jgi:hypothetical protein